MRKNILVFLFLFLVFYSCYFCENGKSISIPIGLSFEKLFDQNDFIFEKCVLSKDCCEITMNVSERVLGKVDEIFCKVSIKKVSVEENENILHLKEIELTLDSISGNEIVFSKTIVGKTFEIGTYSVILSIFQKGLIAFELEEAVFVGQP